MLTLEHRRCERSRRRFVLMLLESTHLLNGETTKTLVERVVESLARSIRDTDIKGWYNEDTVFGVIFTELDNSDSHAVARALLMRVTEALASSLGIEQIHKIALSFHVFPDDMAHNGRNTSDAHLATDETPRTVEKIVKRAVDLAGSLLMLVFSAPLLLMIAAAVKLTSPGPVLFRQTRIGRNGKPFTFLKFRSMYDGNDPGIHREYVRRLIRGELDNGTTEFKMTADPRITGVGHILRKTSFDELPQLFNVVKGEMSLVGPRPPIPYEFECYESWHRRRLIDTRPGITGLWQVKARSSVCFDDMVRLDLRYCRAWSLWLDLKILLETPRAVVLGGGAH